MGPQASELKVTFPMREHVGSNPTWSTSPAELLLYSICTTGGVAEGFILEMYVIALR